MSEVSRAYTLATTLHSYLFDNAQNQSQDLRIPDEIQADIAEPYGTQRLMILGEINGREVTQTMSKSMKNGHLILSTVFAEQGGEILKTRITEKSPPKTGQLLEESLFMQALLRSYCTQ